MKDISYAFKTSASAVKGCHFSKCEKNPIKAHSISNKRLLLKLSENGKVMHIDRKPIRAGQLAETGRGIATTFSGFCDIHDKIFLPIDNSDYEAGDVEQEFLFAFRTVAKELSTKLAVQHIFIEKPQDDIFAGHQIDTTSFDTYREGLEMGVADMKSFKTIFLDTYKKSKFNVIETAVVVTERELPMAVSSTFNVELSPDGKLMNDLSPLGYGTKMKPCFMTVFPQNGKTYCLMSYFRKDRSDFTFLQEVTKLNEPEKEVLVSNLITIYTENFVALPSYWNDLDALTKQRYYKIYESSILACPRPFTFDNSFSLFPSPHTQS